MSVRTEIPKTRAVRYSPAAPMPFSFTMTVLWDRYGVVSGADVALGVWTHARAPFSIVFIVIVFPFILDIVYIKLNISYTRRPPAKIKIGQGQWPLSDEARIGSLAQNIYKM